VPDEYYNTPLGGKESAPRNHPDWVIDSPDADPVYWSDVKGARWNYKSRSDSKRIYWASDKPFNAQPGTFDASYKMCIFNCGDVPEKQAEGSAAAKALMDKAIKCIDWSYKVVYNGIKATWTDEAKKEDGK